MKKPTSLLETLLPVRVSIQASDAQSQDQPGVLDAIDAQDDGFKITDVPI